MTSSCGGASYARKPRRTACRSVSKARSGPNSRPRCLTTRSRRADPRWRPWQRCAKQAQASPTASRWSTETRVAEKPLPPPDSNTISCSTPTKFAPQRRRGNNPSKDPASTVPLSVRLGTISATTRLTGIFGDPIEHSLSPAMHNAAYAALGMDRRYVAFHVTPAELLPALRAIAPLKIAGVNPTLPHKARALAAMDELTAEGRLLGAINCVINRDGKLVGDNTDARGLERDLRAHGIGVEARTVLVMGAGGAGAAAVVA